MNKTKVFKLSAVMSMVIIGSLITVKPVYCETIKKECKIVNKEELQEPNKEWKIQFEEALNKTTITTDNIYVLDSKGNRFTNITLVCLDDKNVKVVPTMQYLQGETYSLCVSDKIKTRDSEKPLRPYKLEFKIKKLDSDFFKIRNIVPVSENMINVFFTQPVSSSAQEPLYYQIFKNGQPFIKGEYRNGVQSINIKNIPEVENGISIYLPNDTLNNNDKYTLKVLGNLQSEYGCRLFNGFGEEYAFVGNCEKNKVIESLDAKFISENIIEVTFNKCVDALSAKQINKYFVKDITGVTVPINKVEVKNDNKTIKVFLGQALQKGRNYNIIVKNIKEQFNLTESIEKNFNVYLSPIFFNDLKIVSVKNEDKGTLEILFDKNISSEGAILPYNYRVIEGYDARYFSSPISVAYDKNYNANKVKLYFNGEFRSDKVYQLTISKNIKDEYGNLYTNDIQCNFQGNDLEYVKPCISSATVIDKNHVKLILDKEIPNQGMNVNCGNYNLHSNSSETRKVIIGCTEVKYINPKTLILTFDGMMSNENYVMKTNLFVDYFGRINDMSSINTNVVLGK